jgi:hypothetical protein
MSGRIRIADIPILKFKTSFIAAAAGLPGLMRFHDSPPIIGLKQRGSQPAPSKSAPPQINNLLPTF